MVHNLIWCFLSQNDQKWSFRLVRFALHVFVSGKLSVRRKTNRLNITPSSIRMSALTNFAAFGRAKMSGRIIPRFCWNQLCLMTRVILLFNTHTQNPALCGWLTMNCVSQEAFLSQVIIMLNHLWLSWLCSKTFRERERNTFWGEFELACQHQCHD